jgi:hypothetical protein
MNKYFFTMIIVVSVLITVFSTAPSTIHVGPDAEVSYDGLHRIDNSAFKLAWADPDIDYSRYKKIILGGAFFEFRAVKKSTSRTSMRASSGNENVFWITDADKERLKQEMSTIFNEEIAKSTRFAVTDTPGDDVLIISGGLHDIVSHVPPELFGRGEIYLRSVAEATLILEAADSMSDEVLIRAVERRAAERISGDAIMVNDVTTWAEIRRLGRYWASKLREGLDAIPTE